MKIYTRDGDKGQTSLAGGRRVPKDHLRLEACGTIDELIAHIGMLNVLAGQREYSHLLERIQENLMGCTMMLAVEDPGDEQLSRSMGEDALAQLEWYIDQMQEHLSPIRSFVIPGRAAAEAQCHIARTVCRRAERRIVSLARESPVPESVLQYVNRLSDFLFVLSRKVLHDDGKNENLLDQKL